MGVAGAPIIEVTPAVGRRIVVVASTWYDRIMTGLIEGACEALTMAQADYRLVRVPGSYELPVAAAAAIRGGAEAVVALGAVVQGETPHFHYVCEAAMSGLMRVGVDTGVPVGCGLLTVETTQQGLDRAGLADAGGGRPSREDKGFEAAASTLATLAVVEELTGST